jgi:hypothetical protein
MYYVALLDKGGLTVDGFHEGKYVLVVESDGDIIRDWNLVR